MNTDFLSTDYLKSGSKKQKRSFDVLSRNHIFEILDKYKPILVGTIPLNIDIPGSDLDIVCGVEDFEPFGQLLLDHFSHYAQFRISTSTKTPPPVMTCNFYIEEMEIEIYATPGDPKSFNGYRHLVIEDRILKLGGELFKNRIIRLKSDGLKTEPAFALLLRLPGDPYLALLSLEGQSEVQLERLIQQSLD